jgi:hypothetical protein
LKKTVVPNFQDLSGIQLKHVGKLKLVDKIETKYAVGAMFLSRNYLDMSSEIFLAIDIPFLENQKLTLVPVFNTGCKKIMYNLGFEKEMFLDTKLNSSFIFEAIQNQNRQYKKFNTGFRFKFKNNSVNLYYMSDTDYNLRAYGLGASLFFK